MTQQRITVLTHKCQDCCLHNVNPQQICNCSVFYLLNKNTYLLMVVHTYVTGSTTLCMYNDLQDPEYQSLLSHISKYPKMNLLK